MQVVLYDACVLYPAPLRDLLMQLALSELYQAKWSDDIHEEWIRNLIKSRPDLDRKKLEVVKNLMNQHACDALVENYHDIIPSLNLPDKDDCHVLAAAIKSSASVILTFNLKDFPSSVLDSYGIEARHPDEFISHLFDVSPRQVCLAAKKCRKRLKNPPIDVQRYLMNLERQSLPLLVSKLSRFAKLI